MLSIPITKRQSFPTPSVFLVVALWRARSGLLLDMFHRRDSFEHFKSVAVLFSAMRR